MWLSIFRWLAACAVQHGAKKFVGLVYGDIVEFMMSIWKWLCEKFEAVMGWFRK